MLNNTGIGGTIFNGGAGAAGTIVVTEYGGLSVGWPLPPDPEEPEVIPPGWPPGVPFRVHLKAEVTKVPFVPPAAKIK